MGDVVAVLGILVCLWSVFVCSCGRFWTVACLDF